MKIVIDAENGIFGRIASFAAKQALIGNEVIILNSEKALISGAKTMNIKIRKELRNLNKINPRKGPFFSRLPEKMMKRAIRGMLPDFRLGRGKIAVKKVKCYAGIPEEFKKEKITKMESKKIPSKFITLEELSRRL